MKRPETIMGVHAPPPRPRLGAALIVACIASLPFAVLTLLELLVF
jgi:hypothetical protein